MNQDPSAEENPQTIIEDSSQPIQEQDLALTENELLLSSLEKSQFDNDLIYALPM